MPVANLKHFLEDYSVRYVSVQHSGGYTAKEITERTEVKGDQLAKTVIVTVDGVLSMVVLPASCRIRWDKLSSVLGTDLIELASEEEFADHFPECDIGAMPPFGNLYEMPTYFYEEGFDLEKDIAFRAGTHDELVKISVMDYMDLAQPMTIMDGFAKVGVKKPDWLRRKAA